MDNHVRERQPQAGPAGRQAPLARASRREAGVPLPVVAVVIASIVLLVINASLLVVNTASTLDSNAQYARSYEIKRSLTTFQAAISAAESAQRGFLLTGQNAYLEPYKVAASNWRAEIERLRRLTAGTPGRAQQIDELETRTAAAFSRLEQTIRRSQPPGPNGAADVAGTDRATATMDRVRGVVERMALEEDASIERLRREVLRDLWVAVGVALLTTVVTVAVLIGLNKLLQRYLRDREIANRALRDANQKLNYQVEERTAELTELSRHLIRVSEEEKAKLARELHDTLGSNLTAINMDLNWIQRRLPEASRDLRERLQRVLQMLADTVELKHQVIEGLRPSHLDNLGLAFAMRSHCREFTRRTGLPCDVEISEDFDDLDPNASIALYRIAQEALTNITKHARASRARVALTREPEGIRLVISDDGVGLLEDAMQKPKSHGIVGMRERVRLLEGQLGIGKGPDDRGTLIDAFIPAVRRAKSSAA